MIKRFLTAFLCFGFPWLVLLIYDNPGGAIVALFMQATVLGWIPASMWAWRTIQENKPSLNERRRKT